MKFYRDKDTYIYNKSLYDKKKRKDRYKRIISALMACQIFCSAMAIETSVKYEIDHENPFEGNKISSSDFSANYKAFRARNFLEAESISDTVSYIKNSDINETKAYILFYALISNDSVNKEDLEQLKNIIKYFCDNPYIDYEYVYNQLFNVKIVERDAVFPKTKISSTYSYSTDDQGNLITPGKIKLGKESDVFHEFAAHGTSKNHVVSWIEEGYASIIDLEYNDCLESYPVESNTIRFLCELMGKENGRECFYKIHAGKYDKSDKFSTSILNLLTSYLNMAGVSENLCEKLYEQMDSYSEFRGKILTEEELQTVYSIKENIVGILAKMYQEAFYTGKNDDMITNEYFHMYLTNILNDKRVDLSSEKFYYFNKEKVNEYPGLVRIYYYYPENLCGEILEQRKNSNNKYGILYTYSIRKIDGERYVEIKENELSLCDQSKIIECRIEYRKTGNFTYQKQNKDSNFELIDININNGSNDRYLEYYNDDPTLK